MGRRFAIVLAFAAALVAFVPVAQAEDFIYFDAHPVHPAAGGGFCEIAGAHVHDYAPVDPAGFIRREGLWIFVGDPVAYGYRGTVYRFDGPHEVPGSEGIAACSIAGVHYHLYAPAVVVAPESGWVVTPVVGTFPWWFEPPIVRRPRPERAHVYPVWTPPPPRVRPPAPPATRVFPVAPAPASAPRRHPAPPAHRR